MKELSLNDLMFVFGQDIKMALYTLDRYGVEANLALIACDDYDVDKTHLIESVRQSDIAKKINGHYIAVLFTFVDHANARTALEKLIFSYHQYQLKGSLVMLKKGETVESVCERLLQANNVIHRDPDNQILDELDHPLV
ncbi:hypothetical protein [Sulfuricurvum sp.]|uniref:hypothetical protein n=1 Tax=Sulfuricurvum sp. TaxID=2025608 RepID=UPI002D2D476C|nr:hypothetical protein [Sulfuricurvum sp.]HZF71033.1 hypothetical protein [Sulfuricurvum sp.]